MASLIEKLLDFENLSARRFLIILSLIVSVDLLVSYFAADDSGSDITSDSDYVKTTFEEETPGVDYFAFWGDSVNSATGTVNVGTYSVTNRRMQALLHRVNLDSRLLSAPPSINSIILRKKMCDSILNRPSLAEMVSRLDRTHLLCPNVVSEIEGTTSEECISSLSDATSSSQSAISDCDSKEGTNEDESGD